MLVRQQLPFFLKREDLEYSCLDGSSKSDSLSRFKIRGSTSGSDIGVIGRKAPMDVLGMEHTIHTVDMDGWGEIIGCLDDVLFLEPRRSS